jgi:hypothetical protein
MRESKHNGTLLRTQGTTTTSVNNIRGRGVHMEKQGMAGTSNKAKSTISCLQTCQGPVSVSAAYPSASLLLACGPGCATSSDTPNERDSMVEGNSLVV